jgi:hypothetical protein
MKRRTALLAMSAALSSCGYKVAGKADLIPKTIRTIAIPPFSNRTTSYLLTDRLPAAIAREFLSRTRYEVVSSPQEADAVLTGVVALVLAVPTIFDPASGRAAGVQTNVIVAVTLTERATGKVLYTNPGLDVRQRYEISIDPQAYFDESSIAFQRMSRDVAATVVSAVLESF